MFVERQNAILAAPRNAAREPDQPRDILLVGLLDILDPRRAGVNEKLPTFQAQPIFGSRTDKRAAIIGAQADDMSMIVNQQSGIDAFVSEIDQFSGDRRGAFLKLFRLTRKSAADPVAQAR